MSQQVTKYKQSDATVLGYNEAGRRQGTLNLLGVAGVIIFIVGLITIPFMIGFFIAFTLLTIIIFYIRWRLKRKWFK